MPHQVRKRDQHYNPFSKEKREYSESGESSEDSYDSTDLALYDLKDTSRWVELEPKEDEWSARPDVLYKLNWLAELLAGRNLYCRVSRTHARH